MFCTHPLKNIRAWKLFFVVSPSFSLFSTQCSTRAEQYSELSRVWYPHIVVWKPKLFCYSTYGRSIVHVFRSIRYNIHNPHLNATTLLSNTTYYAKYRVQYSAHWTKFYPHAHRNVVVWHCFIVVCDRYVFEMCFILPWSVPVLLHVEEHYANSLDYTTVLSFHTTIKSFLSLSNAIAL